MIEIRNLTKKYPNNSKLILNNVSCDLPDKGIVLISGENGSGKTTLFRILSGFDNDFSGHVFLNKYDLSKKNDEIEYVRQNVVVLANQNNSIPDNMTIEEVINLSYSLSEKKEKLETLLEKNNLNELYKNLRNKKSQFLSGGERQLVCIMMCIAKNPSILIFDEPFSSLDITNHQAIADAIFKISKTKLCIIASHQKDFFEATNYIEYVLNDGLLNLIKGSSDKKDLAENNISPKHKAANLSFKETTKISNKIRKKSPKQFLFSIIASACALISFSFSLMCLTNNRNINELEKLISENSEYVQITRNSFVKITNFNNVAEQPIFEFSEKQIEEINKYCDSNKTKALYSYNYEPWAVEIFQGYDYSNLDLNGYSPQSSTNPYKYLANPYSGTIEVPLNYSIENGIFKPDVRFKNKNLCSLPSSINQIALTEFQFDIVKEFGLIEDSIHVDITTPDDLIGLTFKNKTIVGVFSTAENVDEYRQYNYACSEYDPRYKTIWNKVHGNHILNKTITFEGEKQSSADYYGLQKPKKEYAILPLSKSITPIKSLMDNLSYSEFKTDNDGNKEFFFDATVLSPYSQIYDSYWILNDGAFLLIITIISIVFLILSILSNFLLTISFFKNSEFEFAFLIKLGATKKDILRVSLNNIFLLVLIQALTTICFSELIAIIMNLISGVILFRFNLITFVTILLISCVSLGASAISPIVRIYKRPVTDFIK